MDGVSWTDMMNYEQSADNPTLAGFMDSVALMTKGDEAVNGDMVNIMTMHAAKGLEFAEVFIPGMEDELFPNPNKCSEDPSQLEEERRICYVAITRAIEKLHMTYCESRTMFGKPMYNSPSRFLNEIPPEFTEGRYQNSRLRSWT